jgi:hypothetical protein
MRTLQWVASCAILCLVQCPAALAADDGLAGCWRNEAMVQYLKDGTSQSTRTSACLTRVSADKIHSSCQLKDGTSEIEYSYQVVRPGAYSATMTAHNLRPDLIGGQRVYEYRIQDERLYITTYPQTTVPFPPTNAVRFESTSRRVACP